MQALNFKAAYVLALTGPLSSMGSPITLMIRPSVSGPTGMLMGEPVSTHTWPRTRPSVPSIAMVRTVLSPTNTSSNYSLEQWHSTLVNLLAQLQGQITEVCVVATGWL